MRNSGSTKLTLLTTPKYPAAPSNVMVDLFSHALWAYALFHSQPDALAYAAASVLPDVLWAVPAVLSYTIGGHGLHEFRRVRWNSTNETASKIPHFDFIRRAYHFSHSWLIMALLSAAVALFFPKFAVPFIAGVFLHLGMDLFVHKDSISGQLPLYPASKWRVNGFIHWSSWKFLAANYALLAIVYALILTGRL